MCGPIEVSGGSTRWSTYAQDVRKIEGSSVRRYCTVPLPPLIASTGLAVKAEDAIERRSITVFGEKLLRRRVTENVADCRIRTEPEPKLGVLVGVGFGRQIHARVLEVLNEQLFAQKLLVYDGRRRARRCGFADEPIRTAGDASTVTGPLDLPLRVTVARFASQGRRPPEEYYGSAPRHG